MRLDCTQYAIDDGAKFITLDDVPSVSDNAFAYVAGDETGDVCHVAKHLAWRFTSDGVLLRFTRNADVLGRFNAYPAIEFYQNYSLIPKGTGWASIKETAA